MTPHNAPVRLPQRSVSVSGKQKDLRAAAKIKPREGGPKPPLGVELAKRAAIEKKDNS